MPSQFVAKECSLPVAISRCYRPPLKPPLLYLPPSPPSFFQAAYHLQNTVLPVCVCACYFYNCWNWPMPSQTAIPHLFPHLFIARYLSLAFRLPTEFYFRLLTDFNGRPDANFPCTRSPPGFNCQLFICAANKRINCLDYSSGNELPRQLIITRHFVLISIYLSGFL